MGDLIKCAHFAWHAFQVAELASTLGQSTADVCTALSVACRLGFAIKAGTVSGAGAATAVPAALGAGTASGSGGWADLSVMEGGGGKRGAAGAGGEGGAVDGGGGVPRAVAVVLDAEATSFLMMGALSPGGWLA